MCVYVCVCVCGPTTAGSAAPSLASSHAARSRTWWPNGASLARPRESWAHPALLSPGASGASLARRRVRGPSVSPCPSLVGGSSQLSRPAAGRAAVTNGHSNVLLILSLRPFPWLQRGRTFTPEAAYFICSCREPGNKATPSRQREDAATTCMAQQRLQHSRRRARVSDRPAPASSLSI